MSNSFTQGPWRVAPVDDNRAFIMGPKHEGIADVPERANAHLIAAALDMYEGLQDALDELQSVKDALMESGYGGQGIDITKYEQILTKARGESHD